MEIRLKKIKTEEEYDRALRDLECIFDAPEGTLEAEQLEVLALLIEQYENEHYPIDPPDPIDAIKFRMDQMGLSQKDLQPYLGSKSKVSEVLSGKRELTLAMIRALHEHLGIPAEVLIREPQDPLPAALADLDFSRFPLREMEKNGAFRGLDLELEKLAAYAEEAIRRLIARAGGFAQVPKFALRKTDGMRLNAKLDRYALLGWSLQALREARANPPSVRFAPETITEKFIETLVSLSVTEESPRHAREYLVNAGIDLIIVPHLNRTYLDGAVFLVDAKRPVIALTLRCDRLDNFWFVLLHELAHLALGHVNGETAWIADDLELPDTESDREREADRFAAHALLPEDFDLDRRERVSRSEVIRYAREHGVSPALVAGRIRHTKKDFRIFSDLVGSGEVRKLFSVSGRGWGAAAAKERPE